MKMTNRQWFNNCESNRKYCQNIIFSYENIRQTIKQIYPHWNDIDVSTFAYEVFSGWLEKEYIETSSGDCVLGLSEAQLLVSVRRKV